MRRRKVKYLVAGGVVASALAFLILAGFREAVVYFVTPSELLEKGQAAYGKAFRVGGMVVEGSLHWEPKEVLLTFQLTDGKGTVAVRHRGIPPDLFKEGRGAVVEGTYTPEGVFRASTILAKHSEEYKPPEHPESASSKRELFRSLLKKGGSS